jgi:formyltetrahydrofolate-dependent phosphoribosylglycinamide formyltransferase
MAIGMGDATRTPGPNDPIRIAVMVSGHGRGSNLQALLDGCSSGTIRGVVALVVGTRRSAPAMERARLAGVPTLVTGPGADSCPADYEARLLDALTRRQIDLICLAGFMRLLPPRVVEAYRWRIMNVHPALLPDFGGRGMYGERVHRAVLESGRERSGCTVHFVDEEYDHGPIILQTTVPVLDGDTPEALAARILPEEHRTYVRAVSLFAERRLRVIGDRVQVADGGTVGQEGRRT